MTKVNLTGWFFVVPLLLMCFALSFSSADALKAQDEPQEVLIGNKLGDIAMDADFVWIATDKGVNRYDRKKDKWRFFTISNSLISNRVNCIAPERVEGLLKAKTGDEVWFGTDSGISVYTKSTDSWRSYTTRDGLINNKVNAISVRGNDVWIGTDKGASVYDKKKNKWMSFPRFPGIPTSKVTAIYHQASYAWIGTQKGMARYNYKYKKWEYFTNRRGVGSKWLSPEGGPRSTNDSPIPDDRINAIDGESRYIFIATASVLVQYDKRALRDFISEREAYKQLGRARRLARSSFYRTRMSAGARLQMIRGRTQAWQKMGWQYMDISSLMGSKKHQVTDNFLDVKSRAGQTWVATSRGLVRFDSWMGERQIFTKENGLIDNEVTTIATVGSEVWAGTAHGLGTYNLYTRKWKNYRIEKALPSSFVTALDQDRTGMWFGTRGAVSHFAPETGRWKTYTRNEGLAGSNINSIAVVGNYVWFGTNEGVSRFNKSNRKWDNFNANRTDLVSNHVTCILVDGKYVWVGTKVGLNRYDDTTGKWNTYSTKLGLLDNQILSLAADPEYVWVGTHSGLNRYDKSADKWTGYTTADGLGNNVINSVDLDTRYIWVATRRGLSSLDRKTGKWTNYSSKPITAVAVDDGIRIWMGGRGSISYYDVASKNIREFTDADVQGLSRVNVYGAQNTPKFVWFATDGGIFRYNKADATWWTYSPTKQRGSTDTLVDGNVHAIAGNKDFLYFGTSGGISRYDRLTGNWLAYTVDDGPVGSDVRALLLNGPDLWVGTQSGISKYDTVSDTWTTYSRKNGLPSNKVFSLTLEGDRIWAGTHGGAAYLEKGKSNWKKITMIDGLPDDHVWDIAVDDPYLWFATNNGVARYEQEDNLWTIYRVDDGLLDNTVFSIGFEGKYIFFNTAAGTSIYDRELGSFTPFSVSDGLAGRTATCMDSAASTVRITAQAKPELGSMQQLVWLGTYGGATCYDLVSDTASNVTQADGLASNKIQAIRVDGEYIWFGTDSGLSRYDALKDEWITYGRAAMSRSAEKSAGLVSYNIKSLASDDNYLWVGTRTGLSRYDKLGDTWAYFPLKSSGANAESSPFQNKRLSPGPQDAAEQLVRNLVSSPQQQSLIGTQSQTPSTDSPSIRCMAVDGTYLWLGTQVGLFMYDTSLGQLAWFSSEIKNVKDIIIRKDKIWVICDNMVAMLERGGTFYAWTVFTDARVDEEVTSDMGNFATKGKDLREGAGLTNLTSAIVDGHLLWLGHEQGIGTYDTKERKRVEPAGVPDSLSAKKVTAMVSDADDYWIGTRDGLYRYSRKKKTWTFISDADGLASNYVSCLAVDGEYIWVGSSDRGVSRFNKPTSEWETFGLADGLADDNVRAITADGKYVWFGTFSGGVCRYDKTSALWTSYKTEGFTGRSQN